MKTDNSAGKTRVCPYRLMIRARLFSKNREEEFMNCYMERCPYFELYDGNPICKKAEHDYP